MERVVLDTDVVVAAMRSRTGASAEVLRLAGAGRLRLLVSVPLILEYEAVTTRPEQLKAMRATAEKNVGKTDEAIKRIIIEIQHTQHQPDSRWYAGRNKPSKFC